MRNQPRSINNELFSGFYFGLGFWFAFILLAIPSACLLAAVVSIINA